MGGWVGGWVGYLNELEEEVFPSLGRGGTAGEGSIDDFGGEGGGEVCAD